MEVIPGSVPSYMIDITVYNDGVPEDEEGFVVLIGFNVEDLDVRDRGFVDLLDQYVLVRLLPAGESFH